MNMTEEEKLAHALIHYINAEPEHKYGLCYWLRRHHNPEYMLPEVFTGGDTQFVENTGRAVSEFRSETPGFEHGLYVGRKMGFTPIRKSLAEAMLNALEKGDLTWNHVQSWCYTRATEPAAALPK